MKIGFIGAGKVGFSLGKYFTVNGLTLSGYYSRCISSAKAAADFTNSCCYENLEAIVKDSDALFLTVPDNCINDIYSQIIVTSVKGKLICHCSGALSARDAFPDIDKSGAFGYSIHPLFPVSDKYSSYEGLSDAFFTIEGCSEHLELWKYIFNRIGNRVLFIDKKYKNKYHTAAAMASNQIIAVISESADLLEQCGFSGNDALMALKPLIVNNIENIFNNGIIRSLTGPVERSDISTVKKNINSFDSTEDKLLYCLLCKKQLKIAQKKHKDKNYDELSKYLNLEIERNKQ